MTSKDYCSTGTCPNNECFDIVKSRKTVTVPCTRNICESYTVKVPKTKEVTVTKQVPYVDYEVRTKQVPYQYMERRTVVRKVPTCRTIPTIRNVCTTIPVKRRSLGRRFFGGRSCVTKKCPRTCYVTKRCCEPRQFCLSVPRTGWKTVQENVPVQKVKNVPEVQYKTEEVPEVRYRTRQVTKMVKRTVPVYNIVPKPPASPGKERVIQTIRATEEKTVIPMPTVVQSEVVQTSAIPINNTGAVEAVSMYNPGYDVPRQEVAYMPRQQVAYVPRQEVVYVNSGAPALYGYDYIDNGLQPKVISNDTNFERSLGFQEVKVDAAITNNDMVGYGIPDKERFDMTYSNVAEAGGDLGQRRL